MSQIFSHKKSSLDLVGFVCSIISFLCSIKSTIVCFVVLYLLVIVFPVICDLRLLITPADIFPTFPLVIKTYMQYFLVYISLRNCILWILTETSDPKLGTHALCADNKYECKLLCVFVCIVEFILTFLKYTPCLQMCSDHYWNSVMVTWRNIISYFNSFQMF